MNVAGFFHFHEHPVVVERWRSMGGRFLRAFTAPRRRLVLAIGALYVAVAHPLEDIDDVRKLLEGKPGAFAAALAIALLSCLLVLIWLAARRFARWPVMAQRHPQLCLHALFWALLCGFWVFRERFSNASAVIACIVATLPFLLWRSGYLLMAAQRKALSGSFFRDHFFYLWPAFGGSSTPYGKGPGYLLACEARDELSLARAQLSGLRLILLGLLWSAALSLLDGLVLGERNSASRALGWTLGLPRLHLLLEGEAAASRWQSWVVIYLELLHEVLRLAAKGHIIIGVLRIFGFNVFRNTYKPLLAESIVDFWNRYYYYFKELLVNFFFFPAFAQGSKENPRLRLFIAVLAAAFLGNVYYHLIDQWEHLLVLDAVGLWVALGSRLIYCTLLALGIYVSMLREQSRAKPATPRSALGRWRARFLVWTFFAIIHIWSAPADATPLPRWWFFCDLLGLPRAI